MYASLNTELDKGEKAFKRIKEQISEFSIGCNLTRSSFLTRLRCTLVSALYSIRLNKALDSINELNALDPEL